MNQETKCKMKTVLFAILFFISLIFLDSSIRLLFTQNDLWYLSTLILSGFCLFHSGPKMFKNAIMAGWIEFQEEKKDA